MKRLLPADALEVLQRYDIHVPVSDERYLAHHEVDRGFRTAIEVAPVPQDGARILFKKGRTIVARPLPLSQADAGEMAQALYDARNVPLSDQIHSMLAHLLTRCAQLYSKEQLTRLLLEPIYIRNNDYRVGRVAMFAAAKRHASKRLASGAHDVGAVFAYRPTQRGRDIQSQKLPRD